MNDDNQKKDAVEVEDNVTEAQKVETETTQTTTETPNATFGDVTKAVTEEPQTKVTETTTTQSAESVQGSRREDS